MANRNDLWRAHPPQLLRREQAPRAGACTTRQTNTRLLVIFLFQECGSRTLSDLAAAEREGKGAGDGRFYAAADTVLREGTFCLGDGRAVQHLQLRQVRHHELAVVLSHASAESTE